MNMKLALIAVLAAALLSTGSAFADPAPTPAALPVQHVTGIGGFFFRANDPAASARWYKDRLGIDLIPSSYGEKSWTQEAGPTAFAPFPKDTKFGKNDQGWMLDFRVDDLDAMVAQLRASGEVVRVDLKVYPNGRFARLHDPDGNPIELWEPKKKG